MARIAAVYARVSTVDQGQDGTSLDTQVEKCTEFAIEHEYEVPDQYIVREMFSGLTTDRPMLKQVLKWVKDSTIDALVIYSTDRFSRDGLDLLSLIKECDIAKVNLLCVTEDLGSGDTGQLVNFIRGWASGLDARKIKERTHRGMVALDKSGQLGCSMIRTRNPLYTIQS